MEIDLIIGVVVFVVFVAGAISYYAGLFGGESLLDYKADFVAERVMDFLKPAGYNVPIKYHSETDGSGTLYFNFNWPFGKNSTKMYSGQTALDCKIQGNAVYFRANFSAGSNFYSMKFSNESDGGCSSEFETTGARQVEVLVMEPENLVSDNRLNALPVEYNNLKQIVGSDFRVEVNDISYGPAAGRNVAVRSFSSRVRETGENVDIKVLVW